MKIWPVRFFVYAGMNKANPRVIIGGRIRENIVELEIKVA